MLQKTIKNFVSLDFDGCIFNRNCQVNDTNVYDFAAGNRLLLEHIFSNISQHDISDIYVMIGSNRQSYSMDLLNQKSKGLFCYPVFHKFTQVISNYLEENAKTTKVTFDDYLLADTYSAVVPGTSLKLALQSLENQGKEVVNDNINHPEWVVDETKLILLYAQIHRAAVKYPEEQIKFDFYDDRSDILESLAQIFDQHRGLIPSNVTLRLFLYNGEMLKEQAAINSINGCIDYDYHYSVILMAKLCGFSSKYDLATQGIIAAKQLNITEFIEQRSIKLYTLPASAKETIAQEKAAAKEQFYYDIFYASNFTRIYHNFLSLKNYEQNILRAHQKNILWKYGDTDTYKALIANIYELVTTRLQPQRLDDFLAMKVIIAEAIRCDKEAFTGTEATIFCKKMALNYIRTQLDIIKTMDGIIDLWNQVRLPYNILRLHRENIWYVEGNTDSYRLAIKAIVKAGLAILKGEDASVYCTWLNELKNELARCKIDDQMLMEECNVFIQQLKYKNFL